jgi:hypothetical protein
MSELVKMEDKMSKILIALYMASLPGLGHPPQGTNFGNGSQHVMNQCPGNYDAHPDPVTAQSGSETVAQNHRCPEDNSTLSRPEFEGFRSRGRK